MDYNAQQALEYLDAAVDYAGDIAGVDRNTSEFSEFERLVQQAYSILEDLADGAIEAARERITEDVAAAIRARPEYNSVDVLDDCLVEFTDNATDLRVSVAIDLEID